MVKTVVKSPGIPEDASVVKELRSGGAEGISEQNSHRNYEGR